MVLCTYEDNKLLDICLGNGTPATVYVGLCTGVTAGGVVSGMGNWSFVISDPEALRATLGRLGEYLTAPAIEQAVRAYAAAAKKAQRKPGLPGVVFEWKLSAMVR